MMGVTDQARLRRTRARTEEGEEGLDGTMSAGDDSMPATVPEPALHRAPLSWRGVPSSERRHAVVTALARPL
jgi:hypothetical protein